MDRQASSITSPLDLLPKFLFRERGGGLLLFVIVDVEKPDLHVYRRASGACEGKRGIRK